MLQRAWFAPRAQEHSWGGSPELKGSREEAGAWVAGGALPSSPPHARRSDSLEVQRVPQHLFAQLSAARARRVNGSAPRGSAQRSSQAWKRHVQRAPSALVRAGFQASPTRVKLKCPACAAAISRLSAFQVFLDSCLQLRGLERKARAWMVRAESCRQAVQVPRSDKFELAACHERISPQFQCVSVPFGFQNTPRSVVSWCSRALSHVRARPIHACARRFVAVPLSGF